MTKIQIKYENDSERERVLQALLSKFNIRNISKPHKTGKYYRVYVDIK